MNDTTPSDVLDAALRLDREVPFIRGAGWPTLAGDIVLVLGALPCGVNPYCGGDGACDYHDGPFE